MRKGSYGTLDFKITLMKTRLILLFVLHLLIVQLINLFSVWSIVYARIHFDEEQSAWIVPSANILAIIPSPLYWASSFIGSEWFSTSLVIFTGAQVLNSLIASSLLTLILVFFRPSLLHSSTERRGHLLSEVSVIAITGAVALTLLTQNYNVAVELKNVRDELELESPYKDSLQHLPGSIKKSERRGDTKLPEQQKTHVGGDKREK